MRKGRNLLQLQKVEENKDQESKEESEIKFIEKNEQVSEELLEKLKAENQVKWLKNKENRANLKQLIFEQMEELEFFMRIPQNEEEQEKQKEEILDHLKLVQFEKGEVIYGQGDLVNSVYILLKGTVMVMEKQQNQMQFQVTNSLFKGAFLGITQLGDKNPVNKIYKASNQIMALKFELETYKKCFRFQYEKYTYSLDLLKFYFKNSNLDILKQLALRSNEIELKRGEILYNQEENVDFIYFVREGNFSLQQNVMVEGEIDQNQNQNEIKNQNQNENQNQNKNENKNKSQNEIENQEQLYGQKKSRFSQFQIEQLQQNDVFGIEDLVSKIFSFRDLEKQENLEDDREILELFSEPVFHDFEAVCSSQKAKAILISLNQIEQFQNFDSFFKLDFQNLAKKRLLFVDIKLEKVFQSVRQQQQLQEQKMGGQRLSSRKRQSSCKKYFDQVEQIQEVTEVETEAEQQEGQESERRIQEQFDNLDQDLEEFSLENQEENQKKYQQSSKGNQQQNKQLEKENFQSNKQQNLDGNQNESKENQNDEILDSVQIQKINLASFCSYEESPSHIQQKSLTQFENFSNQNKEDLDSINVNKGGENQFYGKKQSLSAKNSDYKPLILSSTSPVNKFGEIVRKNSLTQGQQKQSQQQQQLTKFEKIRQMSQLQIQNGNNKGKNSSGNGGNQGQDLQIEPQQKQQFQQQQFQKQQQFQQQQLQQQQQQQFKGNFSSKYFVVGNSPYRKPKQLNKLAQQVAKQQQEQVQKQGSLDQGQSYSDQHMQNQLNRKLNQDFSSQVEILEEIKNGNQQNENGKILEFQQNQIEYKSLDNSGRNRSVVNENQNQSKNKIVMQSEENNDNGYNSPSQNQLIKLIQVKSEQDFKEKEINQQNQNSNQNQNQNLKNSQQNQGKYIQNKQSSSNFLVDVPVVKVQKSQLQNEQSSDESSISPMLRQNLDRNSSQNQIKNRSINNLSQNLDEQQQLLQQQQINQKSKNQARKLQILIEKQDQKIQIQSQSQQYYGQNLGRFKTEITSKQEQQKHDFMKKRLQKKFSLQLQNTSNNQSSNYGLMKQYGKFQEKQSQFIQSLVSPLKLRNGPIQQQKLQQQQIQQKQLINKQTEGGNFNKNNNNNFNNNGQQKKNIHRDQINFGSNKSLREKMIKGNQSLNVSGGFRSGSSLSLSQDVSQLQKKVKKVQQGQNQQVQNQSQVLSKKSSGQNSSKKIQVQNGNNNNDNNNNQSNKIINIQKQPKKRLESAEGVRSQTAKILEKRNSYQMQRGTQIISLDLSQNFQGKNLKEIKKENRDLIIQKQFNKFKNKYMENKRGSRDILGREDFNGYGNSVQYCKSVQNMSESSFNNGVNNNNMNLLTQNNNSNNQNSQYKQQQQKQQQATVKMGSMGQILPQNQKMERNGSFSYSVIDIQKEVREKMKKDLLAKLGYKQQQKQQQKQQVQNGNQNGNLIKNSENLKTSNGQYYKSISMKQF
ncbi:Cyclic nucleotide-binding protein [Pseudocohnilembus persalinus]|uniref:Cyclic nucleotide-binding protein n=1 Tax=Pseudocohnilembus persalinus TaxID=266149 RepID=A0A0V0QTP4_PSEPJ|nr:Cyclic nucleotide-binding protein [Pseudocohnilembus persalinus]|eukprot:KRX05574.1 Cyclic nucleotide-binding protein [Pseudocohnilembus persalinus]